MSDEDRDTVTLLFVLALVLALGMVLGVGLAHVKWWLWGAS